MSNLKEGYIQIYTGNGKGKTTAAMGLAIRAVGDGMKVYVIQFLKSGKTGELKISEILGENFKIFRFETTKGFTWNLNEEQLSKLKEEVNEGYNFALKILENKECDILILDEVMAAMKGEFLTEEQVLKLMNIKPKDMELILTGRNVPEKIADKADLITEMKEIKHYYKAGVNARKGIEF
ncbi:cob(I)yrinic acid a,c-diamide adenosyltransferase [Clostridium tarantellae]|uniref:Cob(I)yrinic acid a,c-diamide adenosyltransferase n=1 Tax=Clostridium tarantellae TaxID=39493 RepID=A0A6I1MHM7_9CLOT|nr:cob(I)yrinic acid a,c-diamide adenosyltransferase [Clostridium tarantellae]MPQ42650.1 cob(I)yrinic acid a,c-diamide adenosyltransferase [Clostridium tarantellae]